MNTTKNTQDPRRAALWIIIGLVLIPFIIWGYGLVVQYVDEDRALPVMQTVKTYDPLLAYLDGADAREDRRAGTPTL